MPRLPAGVSRFPATLAERAARDLAIRRAIKKDETPEFIRFKAMHDAARKFGPVKSGSKKYEPLPEPQDPVSRVRRMMLHSHRR